MKKAREEMREIEEQLAKGNYIPQKRVPTFKQVAEDWIRHKKPNLRASTWAVYEGHTRNHFNEIDHLKITRITTAIIEKYIADRLDQGMHILTLRKVLVSLGQIMQYAVRHRYIDYNHVREAEKPRGQGVGMDKELVVFNPNQSKALLDAVSDTKHKTLFMLAIMSGARQGELLGLKWGDVDWQNSQIRIRRTFNNQSFFDSPSGAPWASAVSCLLGLP